MEGIKTIKVELPTDFESIEIVPIGDTHVGDEFFDRQLLEDVVQFVLEKENRFVILNGDLINNAIKTSVSDIYEEELSPEIQVFRIVEILKPIKDRILAMGTGNHEERTLRLTGIDPSRYIAVRLGIEERYSKNSFVLFVKVGTSHTSTKTRLKQQVYSIFCFHGYGGGKKNGSKLNNLNDADKIIANADLYVMGHTHTSIHNSMRVFEVDEQNMALREKTKYFLLHNAYLKFGGYGLRQGFAPASNDVSYATFYTQGRKRVTLTLGI